MGVGRAEPDQAVVLLDRQRCEVCRRGNRRIGTRRWDRHTFTAVAKGPPVVGTLETTIVDSSQRQLGLTMATPILHGHEATALGPPQDVGLIEDLEWHWRDTDCIGGGDYVPAVVKRGIGHSDRCLYKCLGETDRTMQQP